jgi:hypothetical protein
MDKHEDLRLAYIAANKEPVTVELLETLLLRAFASHFCGEESDESTGMTIEQLSGCICSCRLGAAYDEDDDTAEKEFETQILSGPAAEDFYRKEVIALYTANGYDKHYAEESAAWPDVLPMGADYTKDMLQKMAKLEVGHDLLVIDYMRATANQKVKT